MATTGRLLLVQFRGPARRLLHLRRPGPTAAFLPASRCLAALQHGADRVHVLHVPPGPVLPRRRLLRPGLSREMISTAIRVYWGGGLALSPYSVGEEVD